jgi:hypothetical protein
MASLSCAQVLGFFLYIVLERSNGRGNVNVAFLFCLCSSHCS